MSGQFKIRDYEAKDFPVIHSWWVTAGEVAPLPEMMPIGSTWVLEIDGTPALSVSLYLTNIKQACWVENFIGNPELRGKLRQEGSFALLEHIGRFAKDLGYKSLFCMGAHAKLFALYEKLGFTETLRGVSTFVKGIA